MLSLQPIKVSAAKSLTAYYAKKAGNQELSTDEAKQASWDTLSPEEQDRVKLEGATAYYNSDEGANRFSDSEGNPVDESRISNLLQGKNINGSRSLNDPSQQAVEKTQRLLGIDRTLTPQDYELLRSGFNPETRAPLDSTIKEYWDLQAAKNTPQVSAYDFTFSAPKGVSLLAAFGDEELRERIIQAHQEASRDALREAERLGVFVARRGIQGVETVSATPVDYIQKHELTSRAGDPQLHSHTLISAIADTEDGRRSTLSSTHLHHGSKLIGTIYQQKLANRLQEELGIQLVAREDGLREVVGIDKETLREYSKRSAEISEKLDEIRAEDNLLKRKVLSDLDKYESAYSKQKAGLDLTTEELESAETYSAYAQVVREEATGKTKGLNNIAALESRSSKAEESESEALARWENEDHPTQEELLESAQSLAKFHSERSEDVVVTQALEQLVQSKTSFGYKDLRIQITALAPSEWTSEEIDSAIETAYADERVQALTAGSDFEQVGSWVLPGGQELTTDDVINQEKRIEELSANLSSGGKPLTKVSEVINASEDYGLTSEQDELLAASTLSTSNLTVVKAPAGAGKTYSLAPVVELHQKQGYQVVGLATLRRTAQDLNGAGVNRTASLAGFKLQMEHGRWERSLSNQDLLEGHDLRTKISEAKRNGSPEEVLKAEEKLARWSERVNKYSADLEKEAKNLESDWEDFMFKTKNKLPADQTYEDLKQRSDSLSQKRGSSSVQDAGEKVLIVLDEAAMVNNDDLESVLEEANKRGWKVVAVGDDKQLGAVGRSTGFEVMAKESGAVELETTYRAKDAEERTAQENWWKSENTKEGKQAATDYLDLMDSKNNLHFTTDQDLENWLKDHPGEELPRNPNQAVAIDQIAAEYVEAVAAGEDPKDLLAMAYSRYNTRKLGEAIQCKMIDQGLLDPEEAREVVVDSKTKATGKLHKDEQVRLTKIVGKGRGRVNNGSIGRVVDFTDNGDVKIKVPTEVGEGERTVIIPQSEVAKGALTYGSSTLHAAQGRTVKSAWMLADESTDREHLYPGMTRGKENNSMFYAPKQLGISEEQQREMLTGQMLRAGATASTLDRSRNHISRSDEVRAAEKLKSSGRPITRESVQDIAEQGKQQAAEKRESRRSEHRKAPVEAFEKFQKEKLEREQRAARQSRSRGRAA